MEATVASVAQLEPRTTDALSTKCDGKEVPAQERVQLKRDVVSDVHHPGLGIRPSLQSIEFAASFDHRSTSTPEAQPHCRLEEWFIGEGTGRRCTSRHTTSSGTAQKFKIEGWNLPFLLPPSDGTYGALPASPAYSWGSLLLKFYKPECRTLNPPRHGQGPQWHPLLVPFRPSRLISLPLSFTIPFYALPAVQ